MKLYERLGDQGFHTTILTTFGVDFDAFENIALARLRGSGCHNNLLIVDQRMLTHALSGGSVGPKSAGKLYSVSGAMAPGVFHSKLVLQLGRRAGRLIVGSANATASGLAGNLEVAGLIECDQNESAAQSLVAAGWRYVSRVLNRDHRAIDQQIAWMAARAPWLLRAPPADGAVPLADGTEAAFLAAGGSASIMDRFVELSSEERADQLLIISPYWDKDLSALKELMSRIGPKRCAVLIDKDRALFPASRASRLLRTDLLDVGPFAESRFVHAKLIVVRTRRADHVLFGSANCTIAALGRRGFAGGNEEACLYRRLPPGTVLQALQLDEFIAKAKPIQQADIPPLQAEQELPLEKLYRQYPGHFECLFDELIWRPPRECKVDEVEIQLLRADEDRLSCSLRRVPGGSASEVHFQIDDASERPSLARLVFTDGSVSACAIVSRVDELRLEAREARSRRAERATDQLSAETEEGLWLLEVLDELEAAENEANEGEHRREGRRRTQDEEHSEYKVLSYEQFIAGRRLRSDTTAVGRNSLAGSELSFVRAFLNRVAMLETPQQMVEDLDEELAFAGAFDLGDEVADAQAAMERGDDFAPSKNAGKRKSQAEQEAEKARRRIAQKQASRGQIVKAVRTFGERIATRQTIYSSDLLRLRALLTVVIAASWSGTDQAVGKGEHQARTSLQVLPVAGAEDCWPRVLGQILFAVFGGRKPAVLKLKVEDIYDQVPDDILECWAICFWITHACLASAQSQPSISSLSASAVSLRERLYRLTGLSPSELLGDRVVQVMRRMGERFATRLGVDPEALLRAHRDYVGTVAGGVR